jgi:Fur family peroxide stress response transcriptional regulator
MIKHSRQRQAILDYLSQTNEHPTANVVYTAIQKEYPNVSLGTVYRNLAQLSERGEIVRIYCIDGADRYDYKTESHYHFMCTKCGNVYDLPMDTLHSINGLAQQFTAHEINGHQTIFYGVCEHCKKEMK